MTRSPDPRLRLVKPPLTEDEENALLEPLPRRRETTLYNLFDEGRSISITTDDERLRFAVMKSDRKWPYANERFARARGDIPFRELLVCALVVFGIGFGLAVVS